MKALICAINTKYIHSSLAPWYLKAAFENDCSDGSECEIIETTINETEDEILKQILEKEFDLIGFSTYIWNVNIVISLCKKIKETRNVEILLGGPEVSYNAREILEKHSYIDYVISGEGERPFAELCAGKSCDEIQGLCYKTGGDVVIKPPFNSCVEPPSPYTKEYFERLNGRIAYIETSRGCPYKCAFCLSGRCDGVKFFDLEVAKKNIVLLANSGAKTVKFIDRTFNADKKRAKELFKFIIACSEDKIVPEEVTFHFEIEGDILDDETIEILSKARVGLVQVEIGLQSFNEKTLHAINRKAQTQRLTDNVKRLLESQNIHVHIDLIAGLPYEDFNSFAESFNKALSLKPHMLQLGFLKLLHGADLRNEAKEFSIEFDSIPPYEVRSTSWISSYELNQLRTLEDFFDRFYNSQRFARTVEYIWKNVDSPFDFYLQCANFVKENQKEKSLDEFSKIVYDYLCSIKGFDKNIVRDVMAMDRLATNRTGSLPQFLKISSSTLKERLNMLERNPATRRKKGIKRAATFLKSENALVYVDYDFKNLVTNEYKILKTII